MNEDIHQGVAVLPEQFVWQETTVAGVQKTVLDKVTGNLNWTTCFLRASQSAEVIQSTVSQGAEIFVLEGEVTCAGGFHSESSYIRVPVGHTFDLVATDRGCLVFYKEQHMELADQSAIEVDTTTGSWLQGSVAGLQVMPLHRYQHENIALVKWAPHTQFNPHVHPGGEEIIVLDGTFHDEHGSYPTGSWLRNRPYSKHTPHTEADGALIYVKTGHLPPLVP